MRKSAVKEGLADDAALVAGLEAVPGVLEVVRAATGMRFAAVARVTADRWMACAVQDGIGLGIEAGGELPVDTTICREVRQAVGPVVISDAQADPVYRSHPTPSMYGFRSYVSTPVVLPDGSFFGVLCALDPEPRDLSASWLLRMFRLHADLIAFQIDAHRRLAAGAVDLAESRRDLATSRASHASSQADLATSRADFATSQADLATARTDLRTSATSLADERESADLREQFIAVLGHDLRNPLASIDAGAKLLAKENLSERGRGILDLVGKSVGRMAGLIDDVLDFARGRLGGGIAIDRTDRVPLAPMLRQVVAELAAGHPDRRIEVELDGIGDCRCDPARIGQLLSNLVANALTHGAQDAPVSVRGEMIDGVLELSVTNAGKAIPPEAMANLFQPFVRASSRPSQQGLGLGLYIASEIARAHGGTLTATSGPEATTFAFVMPA
ncbi:GAF domain-containing sensor histidine kinase [Methylobacterium sp. sgz302541]|uniref:GAF domain-containing sensor histidine kinase n=1 Tax=unclassified Methylobacterium TaxID=2615210 RepID=UPI003D33A669